MPFDSTPIFDPLTFSLGREGLRKLSYLLRHPEMWSRFEWNFEYVDGPVTKHDCGTAGCALGLAGLMWPGHDRIFDFAESEKDQAALFPVFYQNYIYDKPWENVMAVDVADAIDRYLATGNPAKP